jgi:multisubunit Na+/H+ antiporter MnhB subunit
MALPTVTPRTFRACLYGCIAACVVFGSLALADRLLGTALWPDGAEYGVTLLALAGVYFQLLPDRERVERWRVIAITCLALGLVSLLAVAYANPESPLTAVPFALLVVGAVVAYRGLYREWANPRP